NFACVDRILLLEIASRVEIVNSAIARSKRLVCCGSDPFVYLRVEVSDRSAHNHFIVALQSFEMLNTQLVQVTEPAQDMQRDRLAGTSALEPWEGTGWKLHAL